MVNYIPQTMNDGMWKECENFKFINVILVEKFLAEV